MDQNSLDEKVFDEKWAHPEKDNEEEIFEEKKVTRFLFDRLIVKLSADETARWIHSVEEKYSEEEIFE